VGRSSFRNYTQNEKIKIFHGSENVINTELQFFSNANNRIDTCMNYTRPQLAIALDPIRHAFVHAKNRGVKLRYLTEITTENISFCKELLSTVVSELRHLDGIKGNFMISESEYLAPAVLFEKGKVADQIMYSNVKELVEEHEYMFDALWSKAISAEQRIKEIEEGIAPIKTRILEDQDEIITEIKRLNNSANKLSICSALGGMQMSYNYFFDTYKNIIDRYRKEKRYHDGVRWIINIDKDSMNLVQIFTKFGVQIRHIKNMPPMNFGVSDKEVALRIERVEDGNLSQRFLISNEPLYVKHFNFLFEQLWKNGIDAAYRIRDIEAGVDLADIEVIPSSTRAEEIYLTIVKSAAEEILWIFPTTNAFISQEKIGAVQLAKQAAKERNVKVRILAPADSLIEQKVQQLKEYRPDHAIDVRYIEQMTETKATILVVDRKASLVMELRDDSKTTFVEAIGLSTYSNSKAGVLSYVAIFDNLWKQTELYQKVVEANEQLKVHDKMQKEFINIAAHELRTPIQPILGLSDVLVSKKGDIEQYKELLDAIIRNAKRLQKLTEDILDVTKIESQSLQLRKQRINLNEVILSITAEYENQIKKINNVNLSFISKDDDTFVDADRLRLSQVFDNILNNAIKFTKGGSITIAIQKNEEYGRGNRNNINDDQVIVSIKDTGTGIDPEIAPRLFTKFATKSVTGTGLGLYISKSIVEAHGGKMWAENNADGKGATFAFNLPLSK
jgi:two-component system, OmpR family, sensor histidine kinase VicK